MRTSLELDYEKWYWKTGRKFIGGADEVGKGAFAGPVVAGCVIFKPIQGNGLYTPSGVIIDDSKKLTKKQREISDEWVRQNALAWGIGLVGVGVINRIGVGKASIMAFRRAVINTNYKLDLLMIDAFFVPYTKGLPKIKQRPIINGDAKCFSIAAASIIAKVYRDRLMMRLATNPRYKEYRWDKNKGYGTLEHRKTIKTYGITKYHRKVFVAKSI